MRQLIEECAELIQAVNKDWRLNQKTDAEQSAALNEDLEKSAFHVLMINRRTSACCHALILLFLRFPGIADSFQIPHEKI